MNEIVLHDRNNLTIVLNDRLDSLIRDEKYEEAAALRDYMLTLDIKRKYN